MICIASWNIQNGKGVDEVISLERIACVLKEMGDPDVICLQEVSRRLPLADEETGPDQLAEVSALFPGYTAVFGAAVEGTPTASSNRWQFGNATLSRLPILSVFQHALPQPPEPGIRHMPRQAIEITVAAGGSALRIVNTHLEFHSANQRLAQIQRLRSIHQEIVANLQAPPSYDQTGPYQDLPRAKDCIICGDFNMEIGSPEYTSMLASLESNAPVFKDAWHTVYPDSAHPKTCGIFDHRQWPQGPHCRDFFFITASLSATVQNVTVDEVTAASDHQPLMINLLA